MSEPAAKPFARLCRCLVTSVRSVPAAGKDAYYAAVVRPLEEKLRSIVGSEQFRASPGHSNVITPLTRTLDVYKGIATAELQQDRAVVWNSMFPVLELCPSLCDTYSGDGPVAMSALSLFFDFTDIHVRSFPPTVAAAAVHACLLLSHSKSVRMRCLQLPFLTKAYSPRYYATCVSLFQVFFKYRSSGFLSGAVDHAVRYKAVKKLLSILKVIICKDSLDFSFEDDDAAPVAGSPLAVPAVSLADIIAHGMQLVFPMMTKELLDNTKICSKYMDVLGSLVVDHPEKVAGVPPFARYSTVLTHLMPWLMWAGVADGPQHVWRCARFAPVWHAAPCERHR